MAAFPNIQRPARRRALRTATALLVGLALASRAIGADADAAIAPIRAFYDALLAAMKQAEQLGVRGRYDKLAYEADILAFILDAGVPWRSPAHPEPSPGSRG